MKINAKELILRYIIAVIVGVILGYSITAYKVSTDCIDKGHTNIGKGFNCGLRFGDTIE